MIFYLVSKAHSYTMETYLQTWGRALADRIKLVFYEELAHLQQLSVGTYIFSDLERLSPAQGEIGTRVWEQLARAGPRVRLLNHPGQALSRYELLRKLYESGKNHFQVSRAAESGKTHRFPVFLREEKEHSGSLTGLLHSQEELEQALIQVMIRGHTRGDLLIVEFCDTSDASGIFRKYSAFRIGGQIIPRHLIFSHNWILQDIDLLDEDKVREEREWLEQNPHEPLLREMFNLAQIDYGRIDYSSLGSELQVWEINTNPMVMQPPETYKPLHLPAQEQFARRIRSAFEAIDGQQDWGDVIRIAIDPKALRSLKEERSKKHWARAYRTFVGNLRKRTLFQPLARVLKPVIAKCSSLLARISLGRGEKPSR